MIRKPSADWQRRDEGAAVRTIRTASAVAVGGAKIARSGGYAVRGLLCYAFAGIWGFAAITSGLTMGGWPGLASIVTIGAMAALMFWAGNRAFAKARGASD